MDRLYVERTAARIEGREPAIGSLRIYPLEAYPAPEVIRAAIAKGIEERRKGVMLVPEENVPTVSDLMASLRESGSVAKSTRLSLRPADLTSTGLSQAELLGTAPIGAGKTTGFTGVSRTYRVATLGTIELSEEDYVASGAQLILAKEALNTHVGATPAIFWAARTQTGRAMAELAWITPRRSYKMTFLTDDARRLPEGQRMLIRIATQLPE